MARTQPSGRKLPHPEESIFDQGLAFDLETLLDRRRLLKVAGLGGLSLALAACGMSSNTGAASSRGATATTTGNTASEASCSTIPEETDGSAVVRFTSIFPACYSGRWPHIHFEVYPDLSSATAAADPLATSQIALPKASCDAVYATEGYEQSVTNLSQISLESDMVFGDDGGVHELGTVRGSASDGYTVAVTAPVAA